MNTEGKYILNEHGEPVPEYDFFKWAEWFEVNKNRTVKQEDVGKVRVSTVFLGLDHSFGMADNPILWETMVFGGRLDHEQIRCSGSREQAEAMHDKMVRRVIAARPFYVKLAEGFYKWLQS